MSVRLAYAGQRLSTNDTLVSLWVEILDAGEGEERVYKKNLVRYPQIGRVYECHENERGVTVSGENAPKRTDVMVDDDTRFAWEAADTEQRVRHEQARTEKRDKDVTLIRQQILPLRLALARKRGISGFALSQAISAELWRPLTQAERAEAGL